MGAEQMRTIEEGVVAAYEGVTGPDDPPLRCCTITTQSAAGETVWVQVIPGSVNLLYPFASDPSEQLRIASVRSPLGLELIEWEAAAFATFAVPTDLPRELAFFVDQIFTRLLGCDDASYEPTTMIEELEQ